MVPDCHLVRFITTIISNRSFVYIKTSDGQVSRARRLRNGFPQGSVLAPTLFNIYIYIRKQPRNNTAGYGDDVALLFSDASWSRVEEVLTWDIAAISEYLKLWRLKLSIAKTTATVFHLANKDANRQLIVNLGESLLPYNPTPTYLGVKLTYEELSSKRG